MRFDPACVGWAMGAPSGRGHLQAWFRLADGRDVDPVRLLMVLDALPPVTFDLGRRGGRRPSSSPPTYAPSRRPAGSRSPTAPATSPAGCSRRTARSGTPPRGRPSRQRPSAATALAGVLRAAAPACLESKHRRSIETIQRRRGCSVTDQMPVGGGPVGQVLGAHRHRPAVLAHRAGPAGHHRARHPPAVRDASRGSARRRSPRPASAGPRPRRGPAGGRCRRRPACELPRRGVERVARQPGGGVGAERRTRPATQRRWVRAPVERHEGVAQLLVALVGEGLVRRAHRQHVAVPERRAARCPSSPISSGWSSSPATRMMSSTRAVTKPRLVAATCSQGPAHTMPPAWMFIGRSRRTRRSCRRPATTSRTWRYSGCRGRRR